MCSKEEATMKKGKDNKNRRIEQNNQNQNVLAKRFDEENGKDKNTCF